MVPRRPAGVPPDEGDDHDARALLEANGVTPEPAALVDLLGSGIGVVQAAAARVLGADGVHEAVPALERLARDPVVEETARVQAAYALGRLGLDDGRAVLEELVRLDPATGPAPILAAAALAGLGDPRGFPVLEHALESRNEITAMTAAKQLHAFASLDVDLDGAWARALSRPERAVVGEARAQLAALSRERAEAIEVRAAG